MTDQQIQITRGYPKTHFAVLVILSPSTSLRINSAKNLGVFL